VKAIKQPGFRSNPRPTSLNRMRPNTSGAPGTTTISGNSKQEILISTYLCHPSMANNELSGPAVAMLLLDFFRKKKLNKTLRFIFIPETIGSIAFICKNFRNLKKNVIGGYNLSCIGDERMHSCLLTKYRNTIKRQRI
jgi:aminopeptidase-like protein